MPGYIDRELAELIAREVLLRGAGAVAGDRDQLRAAVAPLLCGVIFDPSTSCLLPAGHRGLHAWVASDGGLLVRW